ncbi:hypothetical protein [Streptomyces sp. NPDC055189]
MTIGTQTRRRAYQAVLLLTAAGSALALTAGTASAADAVNGWQNITDPSVGSTKYPVYDFLPVSGDTAFAKGTYGVGSGDGEIDKYFLRTGTTWKELPKAQGLHDDGVWATTSVNDFWVMGDPYQQRMVVKHWNGTAWQDRAPADKTVSFRDVKALAANDVWAVGTTDDDLTGARPATVGHWDGAAWKITKLPQTGAGATELSALHVNSAKDIWAAGRTCTDTEEKDCRGYVVRFDGSSWKEVATPAGTPALGEIAGTGPSDMWAATGRWARSGSKALHWNGSAWKSADVTLEGAESVSDLTYAKGTLYAGLNVNGYKSSGIARWNGQAWENVPGPIALDSWYKNPTVKRLVADKDGALYVSGSYDQVFARPSFSAKLPAQLVR